mgnify:CR=1 FL=1
MRGADTFTESLFTMRHLDDFVPADHPLRVIRVMVNKALANMDELFARMYAADIKGGRPSIAPEKLLRAMLIQVLYSVRSERQLMEQTQYNLLFRWFIGLAMDDAVWVPTVFSKNRERLIEHDAVIEFFNQIVQQAQEQELLSGEHFSVDGTLIQAWAGHKSFVRKDGGDGNDVIDAVDGDSGAARDGNGEVAEKQAQGQPGKAQKKGFEHHEPKYLAPRHADGHEHSEFAGALEDGHEHGIEDSKGHSKENYGHKEQERLGQHLVGIAQVGANGAPGAQDA